MPKESPPTTKKAGRNGTGLRWPRERPPPGLGAGPDGFARFEEGGKFTDGRPEAGTHPGAFAAKTPRHSNSTARASSASVL